ncbi:hypothetical protein Baya_9216 [Bagarius yarrelli]|uniref:Uncharacterized protein n=1 Tax=Bagarius yarrelli TaxID=175774 RepID=A0A556U6B9_BAGYA|nr:hypothetical protein Baya_9216 [Bagarius yarrelli]
MASSGSAGQSGFRLGRGKKNPGVMDQIGRIFGGDKKRKSKGSFRGALSVSPQRSSHSTPRRRTGGDNAVGDQKTGSGKAQKGRAGAGQGTLTRIFKMVNTLEIF